MKMKNSLMYCLLTIFVFAAGCAKNAGEQKNESTVFVYGTGTVMVKPDMIHMNISLSNTAQTTKAAQEEVNKAVAQALDALAASGIADNNILTASLSFSPEYDYGSGGRVLIGQKAEQSITFTVEDIQDNGEKASQIIDRLIQINGITLNRINFGVKNNAEYFARSRELAFEKAKEKANQYAALSNFTVIKPLSISEEENQQIISLSNRAVNQMMMDAGEAASGSVSTALPGGELEITTRISALFLLE